MWGLAADGLSKQSGSWHRRLITIIPITNLSAKVIPNRDSSNPVLELNEDLLSRTRAQRISTDPCRIRNCRSGAVRVAACWHRVYVLARVQKESIAFDYRRFVGNGCLSRFFGCEFVFVSSSGKRIMLFLLLAVASWDLFSSQDESEKVNPFSKLFPVFGIIVSVGMIAFCLVRANSIRHMTNAINEKDEKVRTSEIENAIAIDHSEPMFRFYYGQWLVRNGEFDAAIPQMRIAIENGLANSTSFFRLAVAEQRAGRSEEAEKTFQEALGVYPRSVFLRTAYAAFLKRKGDAMNAETHYNLALAINEKQARSWQLAHDEGLERLVHVSRTDPAYLSPFDLIPADGPLALTGAQRTRQN
jgi:Flp pilus assembly protein TadD